MTQQALQKALRLMSDYEIFGYVSARQQPTFDREVVPGTTIDDLDREAAEAYLDTVQRTRPRAALARDDFEPALVRCSVAADDNGVLRPTLAGLLVFGQYPQQFEGQLVITFLQFFSAIALFHRPGVLLPSLVRPLP